MKISTKVIAVLALFALASCGGSANTVNGHATGGDGFVGDVSPTVDISGNCIATNQECPSAS